MNPPENVIKKPVVLLDKPVDALDHATGARLEQAGFRVVTAANQDPISVIEGGVDVVVIRARTTSSTEAEAAEAMATALKRSRTAVAAMSGRDGGQIIHVVSSIGRYRSSWFRGGSERGSRVLQAAVEGALVSQTRQLAFEFASQRIRVNAVAHGWIRGIPPEPDEALSDEEKEYLLSEISLRRPGEPDEVAAVIAFLAGPASSYITGTVLDVNGGWWMS
jgi:NAD(P)-dependent dehydrogenase (short-subunit alcohol dehydrogenase family)